jgi:RNA polymerase sigma factor (sigma-70 family)
MITIQEAQELMDKFIELRSKAKESKKDQVEFERHERICIQKFKYLVTMRTSRYKLFSNYDDLNQEGLEALVKSMKNYNPKLGNFFWWSHKYIDTRISRSANLHTTIRYPLRIAKDITPHKEAVMPLLIEENNTPDKIINDKDLKKIIENLSINLSNEEKEVINLMYGIYGDVPMSINKVCRELKIPRSMCVKLFNNAILKMKEQAAASAEI